MNDSMLQNFHISIVDDDVDYLYSFKEYLELFNIQNISLFHSSEDFLREIESNRFACDVLILDLDLRGDIPGFLVLPKVKQISPGTKIMIITAYTTQDEIEVLTKKGAAGVFLKPLNETLLADTILDFINSNNYEKELCAD